MFHWHIAYLPFASKPHFVVKRLTDNGPSEYMLDSRTGNAAQFPTKADAVKALRAILKASTVTMLQAKPCES